MIGDLIIYEIRFYIGDIKRKNNFSEEELAAMKSIEIYACKHLVGGETTKISAIKSILQANSEVCRSCIYGFLPIFTIIHNYCVAETKKLNEPLRFTHTQVANNNQSSYNVPKKTEEKNSLRMFLFVPLIIVVLIAFFTMISENRKEKRKYEIQQYSETKETKSEEQNFSPKETNKKQEKDRVRIVEADEDNNPKAKPKINPVKIKEPHYVETFFNTGDIPYKDFFGKGIYDDNSLSELKIINYSSSDAVVLLEHSIKGIIRNVFVKKDFTYTIRNIPEGICIVKIMHGNSWNKEKDNGSGFPKGGFMKNVSFEKTKWSDPFDFTFEEDNDGISYPTYSITLHKVKNGNLHTENISKEEFWD